ncbi:hypothetical protein [Jannaschia sp. R86511]|uniref:hypothetical protein n=1 Tax=Jannaschia sp. R86511 TaxID=3093853 RepID=UPI0036D2194E
MSAPALAPSSRPARPGPERSTPGRSTQARPAPGRPASGRTPAGRAPAGRTPSGRTAPGRAASARAASARAVVGVAVGRAATARALPRPAAPAEPRPRMRVLTRPDAGPRRMGFALTCTALLAGLMLGLLLLNVAISGNAFTMAELQSQRSLLVDQQQALEQQLLVRSSPQALAGQARELGMVPAPQVLVIAPDGTGASPLPEDPDAEP